MNSPEHSPEKPQSISELIGPFFRLEALPNHTQDDDGLVVLETSSGTKVCPATQFNPRRIAENGQTELVVDKWVGAIWKIAKEFEIEQLGFGEWSTAAAILHPLRGQELSFAERIFACDDDTDKYAVVMQYVGRSEYGAAWGGVELMLPNRQLET